VLWPSMSAGDGALRHKSICICMSTTDVGHSSVILCMSSRSSCLDFDALVRIWIPSPFVKFSFEIQIAASTVRMKNP